MRPPASLLVLAAVALLVAGAYALPATRALLDDHVWGPLETQAERTAGGPSGYTVGSLAFWALVGAALAWVAYDLVIARWGIEPDRRFFLSLLPLLVFGPIYHALLSTGAMEPGTAWAYLAAEPLVYLTTAALAVAGLAVGRALGRPHDGLLFVGLVAAGAALVRGVDVATTGSLLLTAGVLLVAALGAAAVAPLAKRLAPEGLSPWAAYAVVAGHALDGATTWLSLRDPFGWGFSGFRESNPVSERLVETSNGWPYFAIKLALPLVLLYLLRNDDAKRADAAATEAARSDDEGAVPAGTGVGAGPGPGAGAVAVQDAASEARLRAFLLFAVFVLGYGPGMSNLMQVVLG